MVALTTSDKGMEMPFKNPHPLYSVWQGMKRRCDNPNFKHYASYGGRGIKVCDRWLHSFHNFVEDMGERPEGYTIDRIDNDGPYSPENCRWASRKDQQRNCRNTRMVTIEGVKYKAVDLAEQCGFKTDTIVTRAEAGRDFKSVTLGKRHAGKPNWKAAVAKRVANQRAATHCKNGHEWSEENTRYTPQGWKNCRTCQREKMRRRTAAKKAGLL